MPCCGGVEDDISDGSLGGCLFPNQSSVSTSAGCLGGGGAVGVGAENGK